MREAWWLKEAADKQLWPTSEAISREESIRRQKEERSTQ